METSRGGTVRRVPLLKIHTNISVLVHQPIGYIAGQTGENSDSYTHEIPVKRVCFCVCTVCMPGREKTDTKNGLHN